MQERILGFVAIVLALVIAGLALFWQPDVAERPLPRLPIVEGGDFTLQSASGPVSLKDYRGKLVLVYFGYTFCPDVCPTSLVFVAEALGKLTPEEMTGVRAYFISVDPERDSPEVLRAYAPFFHPAIVGLTGSPQEIAEVAGRYGVSYMRQKSRDGAPYAVDHSSYTYVIGPDGKLAGRLPHASPASEIVAMIRSRLPAATAK